MLSCADLCNKFMYGAILVPVGWFPGIAPRDKLICVSVSAGYDTDVALFLNRFLPSSILLSINRRL